MNVSVKKQWLSNNWIVSFNEIFVLMFLVGVDQYAKYWFQMRDLVVMNPGGVFGLWPSVLWLFLWFVWGVLVWEWKQMKRGIVRWGLGFIIAGGLSNLLDRAYFGLVRDYIYYPNFGFYGNIADILLAIGGILLVIHWCIYRNDRIAE